MGMESLYIFIACDGRIIISQWEAFSLRPVPVLSWLK